MTVPLTYDQFSAQIVEMLQIDCTLPVSPHDRLYTELALDSLQRFELIIVVEGLADVEVPSENLPNMETMQDAYEYYCQSLRASA